MRIALAAVLTALVVPLAACSDDAPSQPIDAAADAVDAPAGPCGADVQLTGEYVDWTSTTADFMGIFDARFTVTGAPTRTATTAPNGRVILCIAASGTSRITANQDDYNPAVFLVDPAVFTPTDATFSARGLRLTQRASHYQALGEATFDSARAHVLVARHGTPIPFTLAGATTAYAYNDTRWAPGNTGSLVLFPNVPVGGPAALTSTSTFTGVDQVELIAGTVTVIPTR